MQSQQFADTGFTGTGQDGHVAYVEKVNSPTSVVISEMNYDYDNGFRVWTISTTSGAGPPR